MMELHKEPRLPIGFTCQSVLCGLKEKGKDLMVIFSEKPAAAAGIFTRNQFPGVPVILGREIIKKGCLQAIVANSKVSNVGTGETGIANARRMAGAVALEFNIPAENVIMSSTGVIARQLPIETIEKGIRGISVHMGRDPLAAAQGIMTTDTYPKLFSLSVGDATLTVIAKGAGMIEPNMATMLVYILTDAAFAAGDLDRMLRASAHVSFNMLSVDTDTSTSDSCLIMANGLAGPVAESAFQKALTFACIEMTRKLARDGEGATKLIVAEVAGAQSEREARIIAKSIVNSPLIKTMAYGADPNIGRVLMAVGKCFDCRVDPARIEVAINGHPVFAFGNKISYDDKEVRALLGGEEVRITVGLNVSDGGATAYGCDLTEGYIKENAAYYSS